MEEKNKLYVGNLTFDVDNDALRNMFSEFGEITDAVIISDKFSGRSKGFGFVTFENEDDAAKAVEAMSGKEFDGRALTVNIAKPQERR